LPTNRRTDAPKLIFPEALAQLNPSLRIRRRFAGLTCASRFRFAAIIGTSAGHERHQST